MAEPTTIDEYLATLTDEQRRGVDAMRATINKATPGTTETIAYGMPAIRDVDGRFVVSYAAYKQHYSVFAASAGVETQLAGEIERYLTGKGTISFKASEPLPLDLIGRIARIRLAENRARAAQREPNGKA
jgi:uncharacterized protein YdhG (YjbR/CyaY superfamily)